MNPKIGEIRRLDLDPLKSFRMPNFKEESLRSQILEHSLAYKFVREKKVEFQELKKVNRRPKGFTERIYRRFVILLYPFSLNLADRKRRKAIAILSVEEIRTFLCSELAATKDEGLSDDEHIAESLARLAEQSSMLKRHSIPFDEELFGVICDEISFRGIDNLCIRN